MISWIVTLFAAYLLGSLSTALIVGRLAQLPDVRTQGSGNPGATNVLRVAGKKWAAVVLLGDILKGVVAVLLARLVLAESAWGWVALACVLGHLFPVFFGFRGGKGVATLLGAGLGLHPGLGGILLAIWLVTALLWRYSSLASLISTLALPVVASWFFSSSILGSLCVLSLVVVLRHWANIRRLLRGQESKIRLGSGQASS